MGARFRPDRPSQNRSITEAFTRIRELERRLGSGGSRVIDDVLVDTLAAVDTIEMEGIPQNRDYLEGTWAVTLPEDNPDHRDALFVLWFNDDGGIPDPSNARYFPQLNVIGEQNSGFADYADYGDSDPIAPFILLGYVSYDSSGIGFSRGAPAVGTFKIPDYQVVGSIENPGYSEVNRTVIGIANLGAGGDASDSWVVNGTWYGIPNVDFTFASHAVAVTKLSFGMIVASDFVDSNTVTPLQIGPNSRVTLCGDRSTPRIVS